MGTYSVLVHPSISNDSKMTSTFGGQVSINTLQDVTSTLATNGTETLVTLPQPGQVARLTFAGTAGKDWALETRNLNLASTTTDYLGIDVSKPDASSLTSWSCNEGPSCGRVGTQLPTAGTYTVVTTPSQTDWELWVEALVKQSRYCGTNVRGRIHTFNIYARATRALHVQRNRGTTVNSFALRFHFYCRRDGLPDCACPIWGANRLVRSNTYFDGCSDSSFRAYTNWNL